jgi:hypothetical protein
VKITGREEEIQGMQRKKARFGNASLYQDGIFIQSKIGYHANAA